MPAPASAADTELSITAPKSVPAHAPFTVDVTVRTDTKATAVLASSADGRTYRTVAAWSADGPMRVKVPAMQRSGTAKVRVQVSDETGKVQATRVVDVRSVSAYRPTRPVEVGVPAAGLPVSRSLFGTHPIHGTPVPAGAIRLWDTGTSWNMVEIAPGQFHWDNLDRRVAAAEAAGQSILLVLGGTPRWAGVSAPTGEEFAGVGSSMPPRDLALFDRYVSAVMARYGTRIDAFEIWNEANIPQFWRGTPEQMADLTARAYKIIKKANPKAIVVAPSVGSRWVKGFTDFYPEFLAGLDDRGWPVDVYNVHLYPKASGNTADRAYLLRLVRVLLEDAGAPSKPLWETEINYGITNPGSGEAGRDIADPHIAGYVTRTYLDSLRYGVERSYWYAWIPDYDLLGIQMHDTAPAAVAYQRLQDWIVGATFTGCSTEDGTVACRFTRDGKPFTVLYRDDDRTRTVPAPKGARTVTTLAGGQTPVPAAGVTVTEEPVLVQ